MFRMKERLWVSGSMNYMIGTQFHPEADAEGMKIRFQEEDKRKTVIENHGEEKLNSMLEHLNDPDKIRWTYSHILPNFLNQARAYGNFSSCLIANRFELRNFKFFKDIANYIFNVESLVTYAIPIKILQNVVALPGMAYVLVELKT